MEGGEEMIYPDTLKLRGKRFTKLIYDPYGQVLRMKKKGT